MPQVTQQQWITIAVSWLGSGFLSAAITGLYNLRAKRNDYVNDYYKTVIQRRIAAYEALERLIIWLKAAVVDEHDRRPYHLLFAENEDAISAHNLILGVMSNALWLSEEMFAKSRELNVLLFSLKEQQSIAFGKEHYEEIATIRNELERLLAVDMLSLHDVKGFLKRKNKPDPGLHPVFLKR